LDHASRAALSPPGTPNHSSPDVPPPQASGGAVNDLDEVFPTITPGLIISSLPPARARALADTLEAPPSITHEHTPIPGPPRPANSARRLLAALTDSELRTLARLVGMPTEGPFISLYHRLALLC
jgi:hypothetical protein